MIDIEHQLQVMFDRRQADVRGAVGIDDAPTVVRRARRRQVSNGVVAVALAAVLLAGTAAALEALAPRGVSHRPASTDGVVIPQGPIARLTRSADGMVFHLRASGTRDGELCLDLSWSGGTERSCMGADDLRSAGFTPYRSQGAEPWFVAYGIAPERVSEVAVRYAEVGRTTAEMVTASAGALRYRIYLLASPRPVFRGLLGAWDASGDPVGEPQWTWWGSDASQRTWDRILAQCGCASEDRSS